MTDARKALELLPCPFCGGRNIKLYGQRINGMGAWVACISCGLETPTETGVTPDEAVAYWNTRSPLPGTREEVARAHKVMTPEEYIAMPITGWHEVCRDVDGFGGTGIRFLGLAALPPAPMPERWRPIETAPRDGTSVLLLSKEYTDPADINGGPYHHPAKCSIGRWHAEGTSWCDDMGRFPDNPEVDEDAINLFVTGVWYSGGGWFQPNEVTHWMRLPEPPASTPSEQPTPSTTAEGGGTSSGEHEGRKLAAPMPERVAFEELDLLRQWYNAVQDLAPEYLTQADHELSRKIKALAPHDKTEGK